MGIAERDPSPPSKHSRQYCKDSRQWPTARLAAQLIEGLFQVAPSEQVVLRGGPAYLPIMEAMATQVLGAGGKVYILTTTDRERCAAAQATGTHAGAMPVPRPAA